MTDVHVIPAGSLAGIPPKSQKLEDLIERALMEPTIEEALAWICMWDTERAIQQALRNQGTGKGWETCSLFFIRQVTKAWNEKHQPKVDHHRV